MSTENVYIGLGTNMGDREQNLWDACKHLTQLPKTDLLAISPLYETVPVGGPKQTDFLNGIVKAKTSVPPQALLSELLNIEKILGRVRKIRWGPRVIDLDLLVYGSQILQVDSTPNLQIPHPRMHLRRFVLKPICDLGREEYHPVFGSTFGELLAACVDQSPVIGYQTLKNFTSFTE